MHFNHLWFWSFTINQMIIPSLFQEDKTTMFHRHQIGKSVCLIHDQRINENKIVRFFVENMFWCSLPMFQWKYVGTMFWFWYVCVWIGFYVNCNFFGVNMFILFNMFRPCKVFRFLDSSFVLETSYVLDCFLAFGWMNFMFWEIA
jgi:hypothetical protein